MSLAPQLLHCSAGTASFTINHGDVVSLITIVPKAFSASTTTPDLILTLLESIQPLPHPPSLTTTPASSSLSSSSSSSPPPPPPPSRAGPAVASSLDDQNDVYWQYTVGNFKVKITSPATEKHLSKARMVTRVCISESRGDYETISRPFVEARPESELTWVWNILEGKSEAERVLAKGESYVLLPDFKWDGGEVSELYLLAIFSDRSLRSIRDLTDAHLPVLREVRDSSVAAITARYGLGPRKIKAFFHYHPSFYQLHLHLVHVDMVAGEGLLAGRAHMIDDVISNIERNGRHYAEATITFIAGETEPIARIFQNDKK